MKITPLASTVSDNFFYLVQDGEEALLVDPIDAELAVKAARESGATRFRVLTTHGHPDHAGGNAHVSEALDAPVLAPADAKTWPVPHDESLRAGQALQLGASTFEIRHAPGHTDDHLVFLCGDELLSGDVYFVGGAGNCRNGGDPGELYRTFHDRLLDLPDETRFWPGHDYAVKNLRFCLDVEPHNAMAASLLESARAHRRDDGPFLLTLGEERQYNPFHRVHESELQARLAQHFPDAVVSSVADPADRAFRALRTLRDSF